MSQEIKRPRQVHISEFCDTFCDGTKGRIRSVHLRSFAFQHTVGQDAYDGVARQLDSINSSRHNPKLQSRSHTGTTTIITVGLQGQNFFDLGQAAVRSL